MVVLIAKWQMVGLQGLFYALNFKVFAIPSSCWQIKHSLATQVPTYIWQGKILLQLVMELKLNFYESRRFLGVTGCIQLCASFSLESEFWYVLRINVSFGQDSNYKYYGRIIQIIMFTIVSHNLLKLKTHT